MTSYLLKQLISLKEFIQKTKIQSVQRITFVVIENDTSTIFSKILTACVVYLSLPVTAATAERTLSKLKPLKNYLRNSIAQERLTGIKYIT